MRHEQRDEWLELKMAVFLAAADMSEDFLESRRNTWRKRAE
jgi:hypothetical protein